MILIFLLYIIVAILFALWGRKIAIDTNIVANRKINTLIGLIMGAALNVVGIILLYLIPKEDA